MLTFLPEKMPENIEAEAALLARVARDAAFGSEEERAAAYDAAMACKPEYFVKPQYRLIFESIVRLYAEKQCVTPLAIREDMRRHRTLEAVGDLTSIAEVLLVEWDTGGLDWAVGELGRCHMARKAIDLAAALIRKATEGEEPIEGALSDAEAQLAAIAIGDGESLDEDDSGAIDQLNERIAFREQGEGSKLVHFGLQSLDDAIECSPGHMVIIAARAGDGKTALAVQSQMLTAWNHVPSLFISLEMDKDEMRSRKLAWLTGENYGAFRSGQWTDNAAKIANERKPLFMLTRQWYHAPGVAWSKVEAVIRNSVRLHGVRTVFIDHALLVGKPSLGRNATDASAWNEVAKRIKTLAQELKICIVALCQLNRNAERAEPSKAELKETGAWEEFANAVIVLYPRDPKATEDPYAPMREIYVKVAKNRSGQGGWKRPVDFYGATSRFDEVEREVPQGSATFVHECLA